MTHEIQYVHRDTVNKKEGLCVPRIFVQAKFIKPVSAKCSQPDHSKSFGEELVTSEKKSHKVSECNSENLLCQQDVS